MCRACISLAFLNENEYTGKEENENEKTENEKTEDEKNEDEKKKEKRAMEGAERRQELIRILQESNTPVSGSKLAGMLGVSRQVIVQDVALLRAVNQNILPTTRGYILYKQASGRATRVYLVRHTTEQIGDELGTIVELGGKVLNVVVSHEIYGQIEANLGIETKQEVEEFVRKLETKKTVPLKELTDGLHFHTVEADSEEILDQIGAALQEKGYLAFSTLL